MGVSSTPGETRELQRTRVKAGSTKSWASTSSIPLDVGAVKEEVDNKWVMVRR